MRVWQTGPNTSLPRFWRALGFARSGWWISDGGLRRAVVVPTAFAVARRASIELDGIVVAVASDAT